MQIKQAIMEKEILPNLLQKYIIYNYFPLFFFFF